MQSVSSIALVIAPVQHLAEYVIGFPMYVAITVASPPNLTFNGLRFADFLDLRQCIGAEIAGPGGYSASYQPATPGDVRPGERTGRLARGESRRMLVDVSPYFVRAVEGPYSAQLSYLEANHVYIAPTVTFALRQPAASERTLLESAAPDRPSFVTWGQWSTHCPAVLYKDAIGHDNPLRFNLLLRRLLCGAESLRQVNPATLDVLTGLYTPEARALQAELYRIRGDRDRYDAVRSDLLRETPGLAWWVRMIDDGGSYLKSLRFLP
jgi:hypothetical protein